MKRVLHYVLPALCVGAATLATADEDEYWYVGLNYNGAVEINETTIQVFNPGTAATPSPIPGLDFLLGTPATPASLDGARVLFDSGDGFGLVLGYDFDGLLRTDIEVRYLENEVQSIGTAQVRGDLTNLSGMLNVWADFNRDGELRPYIGAGAGAAEIEFGDDDDAVLMAQVGAGLNWHINDNWLVDLGYRYFITDDPEFESANDFQYDMEYRGEAWMLGVNYKFGHKRSAPPAPADTDGDGVPDNLDRCPGTPPGTPVNAQGCADSDGDGVIDSRDRCPTTLPGAIVDAEGCADSDGDGISDRLDSCPNSPAGQPVLANGCGASQSTILQGVNFKNGSDELTTTAMRILEDVAAALLDSSGFSIEIQGHTDSVGDEDYNKDLSKRRANSVKDFLVNRGVEPGRLIIKGYGEIAPIADNKTPDGRATNRRVELKVISVE